MLLHFFLSQESLCKLHVGSGYLTELEQMCSVLILLTKLIKMLLKNKD